jgi:hypothetical protein
MRADARVEDFRQRLKDSGLERFPFTDWEADQAWLQTVMFATDFVTWFQMLCLPGPLAVAKAKRLRWSFWHASSPLRDVISSASSNDGPPPKYSQRIGGSRHSPESLPSSPESVELPRRLTKHVSSHKTPQHWRVPSS